MSIFLSIIGMVFLAMVILFWKTIAWAIRHPRFAWCWFRHGQPYSAIHKCTLLLALLLLATASQAQTAQDTNAPTGLDVFLDHAMSASNYTAVIYGTHFDNNKAFGGGFMALYNIGDYVSAGLGSDYAGEWRMFSGTVTIHKTWQLTSRLSVNTYGVLAAGTSVGGAGTDNGSLATGEGGGAHFNYQFSDKLGAGIGTGYIQRQGCGEFSGGSEILTFSVNLKL